jgi:CheY-like chemotaxis protein
MEDWKNFKILVVEDNRIKHFMIAKILSETNIQITIALNGKIAVELCNKNQFDIVLMNITMPVMDGYEATREIRKFNRDVPIIANSNWGNITEKCLECGCNDFIRNPMDKEELFGLIKKYLNV